MSISALVHKLAVYANVRNICARLRTSIEGLPLSYALYRLFRCLVAAAADDDDGVVVVVDTVLSMTF